MTLENVIFYLFVFLYGIIIGSFLNVCIYRIPKEESIVTVGSHCMNCGHALAWYDLFPVFSWLALRGKCRYCGDGISVQYPLIEMVNGVLYVMIFMLNGWNVDSLLWCVVTSALLVISVIDYRTMLIPTGANLIILLMGILHLIMNLDNWVYYVTGFLCVSLFLLLTALLFKAVTKKSGLGLGDVELMACAGMCLGWGHSLLALVIGSVLGSLIQGGILLVAKKGRKFALGPYLAVGIWIAMLWGDAIIRWYMGLLL